MFNPLLPNLSKLKNEDIELKITELMKKYLIAAQSGQGQVCNQISVILEAYKAEQHARYELSNKKLMNQNKNLDDYINIDR
jgi:hypothetical protein